MIAATCTWGLFGQDANAVDEAAFRFDTTTSLYEICAVPQDASEYVVANQACRAFIEASVQYHDEISNRKKLKRLICYPKTATIEDGKQAFIAWASAHSGDKKLMSEQPVVGLVRALAAKYPCAK
ncbi:hypothetical protein CKO23_14780 [Thiocystis violacea]|nr:hypothetical protein [Thiocystis violacea]